MPRVRIHLLLLLLVGVLVQPATAADPFYTRLLQRGVADLELGLADEAEKRIRIACFGFLEEPALLTEGLMQLGRAQALAAKTASLLETVERLAEIEERFESYSGFNGDLKQTFEEALRDGLPAAQLERMPLFAHLTVASEPVEEIVRPLTPKQQRKALEQQLEASPNDGEALLALAELHFANGKLKPASQLLDRLLATQPMHEQALCRRAEIAVERKECVPMLAGADRCPNLTVSNRSTARVLDCLTRAQRSDEALELLESLPEERRLDPAIARAAGRIDSAEDDSVAGTEPDPVPTLETPAPEASEAEGVTQENPASEPDAREPEATPDPGPPEIRLGLTLEERMRRLRDEVTKAGTRGELESAFQQAFELADDYPDSAEAQHLAAEIAYLSSNWNLVIEYFDRGGRPLGSQPILLFYLAVATYEVGDTQEAARLLEEALPTLRRNSFVNSYIDKILPPSEQ